MASIKHLKQDLNNTLSEIIESSMLYQMAADETGKQKAEKIIEDSISFFDEAITEINNKKVEDRAKHLKAVKEKIENKVENLVAQLNEL